MLFSNIGEIKASPVSRTRTGSPLFRKCTGTAGCIGERTKEHSYRVSISYCDGPARVGFLGFGLGEEPIRAAADGHLQPANSQGKPLTEIPIRTEFSRRSMHILYRRDTKVDEWVIVPEVSSAAFLFPHNAIKTSGHVV